MINCFFADYESFALTGAFSMILYEKPTILIAYLADLPSSVSPKTGPEKTNKQKNKQKNKTKQKNRHNLHLIILSFILSHNFCYTKSVTFHTALQNFVSNERSFSLLINLLLVGY